jgi:hypothetical protein
MYCAHSRPAPYCKAPYLYIVMHDPRFAVFWTMNMNYLVFEGAHVYVEEFAQLALATIYEHAVTLKKISREEN